MNVWQQGSAWFQPALGIDRVAELLDIQPASVRRYLTDHSGFPEPTDQRGNRNFWTPAAIYRHVWDTKPRLRQSIPRLCPLADDIPPAEFIESEVIETRGLTYVLHTWEPGDRRGRVGVAYAKDFQRIDDVAVAHLLSLRPHLSAVTLAKSATAALQEPRHPQIVVADHAGTDWYPPREIGWQDLTALLQVDLPWWSYGLTDVDAMNRWRPGTPVAHIRPHVADFTADHFERCRPLDGSPADRALAEIADATDRALAAAFGIWPSGQDQLPNRPGLQHAAIAVLSPRPPGPVSPDVIRDALRYRVDDKDLAVRAVDTARGFEVVHPAITHELLTIDRDHCSRLAHEWCHRLTAVEPARCNEIGYHWVTHTMDQQPYQWWRDPLNTTVWAISAADDGTTYATLGTRMPARGRIEELAIEDRRPFFRDSAGNTFPVPSADGGIHRTDGSSATRLTATILALMDDASRDIFHADHDRDVLDTEATGLYEAICDSHDTVILSRSDLEELREETPQGAARREEFLASVAPFRTGGFLDKPR
ncbi:hypothetical protein [Mycobacterium avium]|uniref:hypothetical protein n=1 Tax=Mycobacterium avium TaxID=1764 RepID=UPI00049EBDC3|nr:hypothetical protein [Mycobacterium avium]KDP00254.1 hypothetical protein MAV100_25595 [Mycobacterium avium subsp. hominissuis 100]MBZ4571587.1 hypothetical protein [Mycobacterium avium subsp. hominissuis]